MIDPIHSDQSKHTDAEGKLRYNADGSEVFPGPTGVRRYEACDICGEGLGDEARAEVIDTSLPEPVRSTLHLIVHAEPCSYEHGDRYKLA